ncbi:MAG: 50S ribosomal protein L29 [Solirubrobacteraceae bacterium]
MPERAADMRDLTDAELGERIATTRRELFGLRFQNATGELENTAGIRANRRALARALTIARERALRPHESEEKDG